MKRLYRQSLDADRLRSAVWHALLLAYILVAAAPTIVDLIEKSMTQFRGALF
jgi:hypothetical protein